MKVNSNGAVLLGNLLEIDGYYGRPVRVITHFHSDHIKGIRYSSKTARTIIATLPTLEALEVLEKSLPREKTISLDYNSTLSLGEEKITFLYSRHIFGSTQVLVETEEGAREGYTGDFKFPGTKIMKDLDVLVLDATYGSPEMNRWFKNEIDGLLVDFISTLLSHGYPITIHAYYGKMQEIMEIMRRFGLRVPFIMPKKAYELTKVGVKHGLKIDDYYDESSEEAREIIKSKWFVRFVHYNSKSGLGKFSKAYQVYVTGWIFDKPIKEINNGWKYIVGFSDHADFQDTFYYVQESRPKNLIIDCSRTTYEIARKFAKEVLKYNIVTNVSIAPSQPKRLIHEED